MNTRPTTTVQHLALAGIALTATVAAVAAAPLAAHARPVETTRQEAPVAVPFPRTGHEPVAQAEGPCFLVRARWNVALDGPQPTCHRDPTRAGGGEEARERGEQPPILVRPNAVLGM